MYSRTYKNGFISLDITSDCEQFLDMVDKIMDFDEHPCGIEPDINIRYEILSMSRKDLGKNKGYLYQNNYSDSGRYFSRLGLQLGDIRLDVASRSVKGYMIEYDEKNKEVLFDFLIMHPARTILSHAGYYYLHAAALEKEGTCVVISGSQSAGKSTLSTILAKNGYNILTDDDCFLNMDNGDVALRPFPVKVGVGKHILRKYPEIMEHVVKDFLYGDKARVSLKYLSDKGPEGRYHCGTLLFPKYSDTGSVSIKSMKKNEALKELLLESHIMTKNENRAKTFKLLFALVAGSGCYEMKYNDEHLDDIVSAVFDNTNK